MAAAEYFQQGQPQQPPSASTPNIQPPPPTRSSLAPLPYPISDEPPPYSSLIDHARPHSQPPPTHRVTFSAGHAPEHNAQQNYPAEKGNIQNMYHPSDFGGAPQYSQQQGQFSNGQQFYSQPGPSQSAGLYPPGQPMQGQYMNDPGRRPSANSAFYGGNQQAPQMYRRGSSRSRSRDRSYSRDRERRHHHSGHHHNNSSRPTHATRKKSSGVATFLGAGGGALIGDAIFPGLGTLGGMIIGGVGGHEYGKQRKSYGPGSRRPRSYSNEELDYYEDRRGRRN